LQDVACIVLCECVRLRIGRYDTRNMELPALEAPGAAGIGYVGLAICCVLIAAIMMLDCVGIHKHLVFLRKNVHFGWNRFLGLYYKKQPPEEEEETPETSSDVGLVEST